MHQRFAIFLIFAFPGSVCYATTSPFLLNMPQNSEQRCVGICGVAEALLEGRPQESKLTNIDDLAHTVYESFTTNKSLDYPSRIMLKGKAVAVDSPPALAALSDRVADLYKADFFRLAGSREGARQLLLAQESVVRTHKDLDTILASDPDKTIFVCCFGTRTFPDRTMKDTNHAVLIQAASGGKYVVYDPNDPGRAIACNLTETAKGILVTWECRYRDHSVTTKQSYLMVPQQRYFKALSAPVRGQYSLIRQSRQSRPDSLGDPAKCDCEK